MKRLSAKNIVSENLGQLHWPHSLPYCSDEKTKQLTGIDENSRILLISTEGLPTPIFTKNLLEKMLKKLSPATQSEPLI